jgi:hypothetical protein
VEIRGQASGHWTALIDHVCHDTDDWLDERPVYVLGYWRLPEPQCVSRT